MKREEIKKRLEEKKPIQKFFTAEIVAPPNPDRTVTFVISTGDVDRDGDIINPDGWDLTKWINNPQVLYGHDYSGLPVANGLEVWQESGKLMATAKFIEPEIYPFADIVYRMVLKGYLRACSVGFQAKAYEFLDDGGIHFKEQELLEFSVVTVPANPDALISASAYKETKDAIEKNHDKNIVREYAKALSDMSKELLGTNVTPEEETSHEEYRITIFDVNKAGKEIIGKYLSGRETEKIIDVVSDGDVKEITTEGSLGFICELSGEEKRIWATDKPLKSISIIWAYEQAIRDMEPKNKYADVKYNGPVGSGACPHCGEKFEMHAESTMLQFFGVTMEDVEEAKAKREGKKYIYIDDTEEKKNIARVIEDAFKEIKTGTKAEYDRMRETGKV